MNDVFEMQKKLQNLYWGKESVKGDTKYIKEQILCLVNEAMEAMNEVPWKYWKKTQKSIDMLKFSNELVDIQLFLLNLVLATHDSLENFIDRCREKQTINLERIKNAY